MINCQHIKDIKPVEANSNVCEDCVAKHDTWLHLRICMTCGNVACCDSSKNSHATKHFQQTGHPIIFSFEPGENWGYCYEDKVTFGTHVEDQATL